MNTSVAKRSSKELQALRPRYIGVTGMDYLKPLAAIPILPAEEERRFQCWYTEVMTRG